MLCGKKYVGWENEWGILGTGGGGLVVWEEGGWEELRWLEERKGDFCDWGREFGGLGGGRVGRTDRRGFA